MAEALELQQRWRGRERGRERDGRPGVGEQRRGKQREERKLSVARGAERRKGRAVILVCMHRVRRTGVAEWRDRLCFILLDCRELRSPDSISPGHHRAGKWWAPILPALALLPVARLLVPTYHSRHLGTEYCASTEYGVSFCCQVRHPCASNGAP